MNLLKRRKLFTLGAFKSDEQKQVAPTEEVKSVVVQPEPVKVEVVVPEVVQEVVQPVVVPEVQEVKVEEVTEVVEAIEATATEIPAEEEKPVVEKKKSKK